MKAARRGQGLVEYAVVVGAVALLLVPAVSVLRQAIERAFDAASRGIEAELTAAPAPPVPTPPFTPATPPPATPPATRGPTPAPAPAPPPTPTRTKKLSWAPDPTVAGYRVRWGRPGKGVEGYADVGTSARYELRLTNDPYTVWVTAYNAAGVESAPASVAIPGV